MAKRRNLAEIVAAQRAANPVLRKIDEQAAAREKAFDTYKEWCEIYRDAFSLDVRMSLYHKLTDDIDDIDFPRLQRLAIATLSPLEREAFEFTKTAPPAPPAYMAIRSMLLDFREKLKIETDPAKIAELCECITQSEFLLDEAIRYLDHDL